MPGMLHICFNLAEMPARSSWNIMRDVVRNALIGATISSVLGVVLLLIVRPDARAALTISPLVIHPAALEQLTIDVLFIWCGATLGAIAYGAFAVRLGIYGEGDRALSKWRNGLLGLLIVIAIGPIASVAGWLVGVSAEATAPLIVATGLATAISDACAPSGAAIERD
jgi:hypothetical protein